MPEKRTLKKARAAKRAGMSPSTQAGAFVHEEIEHVREGKHGARSTKQAIAIGLAKARRAGVKLPPPPSSAKETTKRSAASASRAGMSHRKPSARRSRAMLKRLKRERHDTVSTKALSRQATNAARRRSAAARKRSAQKAARTRRRRASA